VAARKPLLKVGVVAVGYIAAFLVASAAVGVRLANTSGLDAQASSGMYVFGEPTASRQVREATAESSHLRVLSLAITCLLWL
jgi:hypothetical protein